MINPFKKYPYIVVEGPIGSGKSTLSRMLSENFGAKLSKKGLSKTLSSKVLQKYDSICPAHSIIFLFQRAEQINEVKQNDFFIKALLQIFYL